MGTITVSPDDVTPRSSLLGNHLDKRCISMHFPDRKYLKLTVRPSQSPVHTNCLTPAMSSDHFPLGDAPTMRSSRRSESSDDDERRLKRREKNRVAAQRSRKRQTQRADELHEAYECLEQQNSLLKKEVQLLLEEQKRLAEALQSHEPLCPILNSHALPTLRNIDVILPSQTR